LGLQRTAGVAFVTDDAYDAVIAVDLRTGNRQLIAK
jgi:hypothetical protein